ncbi:tRNA (N6-threonylcarbamoyladenosine(37)-N6)-methyltransferase TrmO [Aeromonas simiae]|uniref:tRNA (N6-threonylcarbamoyladenosine(37)-N6)-methyltransferase TrmO n=1 Tax=Aeromonas simiae TaxID=218936 RepID=UPI0005A5EEB6|nr:tRNA (N6-threonylcarbamoyladenosine(37)-N6)-methyltransferase TrmO [Aeromonas simiae]MDO2949372.1 tRNA (N6-threonylcarbamoyladenosine(37)-N6)-methyltransferase TrmO [Aeromonas simiae]MDO2952927.1 tRNA (N6-threonylcarbamoyladenosine(37)-N6)-methyltransferase TrmO [Aeromonas simiae]MDO2956622.1 tRNA (N6-threonylcarbamoyladenosine(37)-N6)-methyltransferase TrmO [Aeromonas simiae]
MKFEIDTLGVIHSPYKEKFAIPRQPGLVRSATARLELLPPYNQADAVRGLEQFSHLWLSFVFHQTMEQGWHPTVRPPRLGGNERVGVFATRSTFRPNPLGLSVVPLLGVTLEKGGVWLELGAVDLLDGTPVVDIKPYLPYADSLPHARGGFAPEPPGDLLSVRFHPEAEAVLARRRDLPTLRTFLSEVLAQDPRPAYKKGKPDDKEYGVRLYDMNVRFRIHEPECEITAIEPL